MKSTISFIDGDKGILRYRGYPIEQLAEKSSFLEVRMPALVQTLCVRVQLPAGCRLKLPACSTGAQLHVACLTL